MNEAPKCHVLATLSDGRSIETDITDFPCTIGRALDNRLTIPDSSMSSHHARLMLDGAGRLVLEDSGSTNGIYLGTRKMSSLAIEHPIKLIMGKVSLELVPSQSASAPAVPTFSRQSMAGKGGIICPHCWHRFEISDFLFIARHQSLVGDPILGEDAQQRFLPSRFTAEGNAIDAMGMSCPDMACPYCHLRIPQAAREMPPLFLSIVGATASGKTYFLTSMTWELRNVLSRDFAISFTDTDAVNNQTINDFEETVFLNPDQNTPVALRKTELQGDLYNQIRLNNMMINLPRPFMFTITPTEHHPQFKERFAELSRTLVLYDNAGEHFEPGMEQADNPTTQHLLHSDSFFFLFDPTKDVRFRRRITGSNDYQLEPTARTQRQEIILTEMINRIRKFSGLRSDRKIAKSLIIVVTKSDIWSHMLDLQLPENPWTWSLDSDICSLDVPMLRNVSFNLRMLLEEICPELVNTAEAFSQDVIYIPNSALGHSPEKDDQTGFIGIRPADIKPFWVTAPILYYFYEKGFIPGRQAEKNEHPLADIQYKLHGDLYMVRLPGINQPLRIPLSYAGYDLHCPGTDLWFRLPKD